MTSVHVSETAQLMSDGVESAAGQLDDGHQSVVPPVSQEEGSSEGDHPILDSSWTLSAQEVSPIAAIPYLHMASNRHHVKPSRTILGCGS